MTTRTMRRLQQTLAPRPPEPAPATVAGDRLVRVSSVAVVVAVALGAAFVSYRHAYELVHSHGEIGAAAAVGPATVDGMIYASGMVLLQAARYRQRPPLLAHFGLWLGILATVGANVAHGAGHGWVGALVSAWPAVALIVSYEQLMRIIRAGGRRGTDQEPGHPAATGGQCPHRVAETVDAAVVTAFLHGRDCLGEAPSQRHLSAAFGHPRDRVAALIKPLAGPAPEPGADQAPARPAPAMNGHPSAAPDN